MRYKFFLTAGILALIYSPAYANLFFHNDNSSTFCKSGFYAGAQGGHSDTFYTPDKVLTPVTVNTPPASVQSIDDEEPQYVIYTTTASIASGNQKVYTTGIGGRIYAGYQFTPYFALEGGYTQYGKTTFNATTTATSYQTSIESDSGGPFMPGQSISKNSTLYYSGEVTEHAFDLVAKGTLPLPLGIGLYVKAGAAYISAAHTINSRPGLKQQQVYSDDGDVITTNTTINNSDTVYTKSYQAFRPVGGIGINYTLPHTDFSIDASYTRVFSSGAIPHASLLALGIEYKFA
jgi:hypothetical protein